MNVQVLEKLVRQAIKGEDTTVRSSLLNSKALSGAEVKSFQMMNTPGTSAGTVALIRPNLTWL